MFKLCTMNVVARGGRARSTELQSRVNFYAALFSPRVLPCFCSHPRNSEFLTGGFDIRLNGEWRISLFIPAASLSPIFGSFGDCPD